jgi:hypothetical protein
MIGHDYHRAGNRNSRGVGFPYARFNPHLSEQIF